MKIMKYEETPNNPFDKSSGFVFLLNSLGPPS